jgi:hypothetical protein
LPRLRPQRGPVTLKLSTDDGDYAEAVVQIKDGIAEAQLKFEPAKVSSAHVEIMNAMGKTETRSLRSTHQATLKLAESKGGSSKKPLTRQARPVLKTPTTTLSQENIVSQNIIPSIKTRYKGGLYNERDNISRPWPGPIDLRGVAYFLYG